METTETEFSLNAWKKWDLKGHSARPLLRWGVNGLHTGMLITTNIYLICKKEKKEKNKHDGTEFCTPELMIFSLLKCNLSELLLKTVSGLIDFKYLCEIATLFFLSCHFTNGLWGLSWGNSSSLVFHRGSSKQQTMVQCLMIPNMCCMFKKEFLFCNNTECLLIIFCLH